MNGLNAHDHKAPCSFARFNGTCVTALAVAGAKAEEITIPQVLATKTNAVASRLPLNFFLTVKLLPLKNHGSPVHVMNYQLPLPIHANVERRHLFAFHDVTLCEFFTLINLKL